MGYIGAIIGALTALASGTAKGVQNKKAREQQGNIAQQEQAQAQAAAEQRRSTSAAERGGFEGGGGAAPTPQGRPSAPGQIPMRDNPNPRLNDDDPFALR